MPFFEDLFYLVCGAATLAASIAVLLFTLIMIFTMIGGWIDDEYSLKDKIWFTLFLSVIVGWGGFVSYTAMAWGIWMIRQLI